MKHRFLKSAAATLILGVAVARSGSAQNFYSTGVTVLGVDQNWTVSTGSGGVFTSVFGSAFTGYGGTWISNSPTASNPFAPWFTFRQSFDLTGFNAATAALSFQWGCDDVPGAVSFTPVFSLNGGAAQGSGTCGAYGLGGTVNVSSGFAAGVNTLDYFVVGNGTTDAMRLDVLSFTAQPAVVPPGGDVVPEPATMGLLATGLLSLAGVRRRKKA